MNRLDSIVVFFVVVVSEEFDGDLVALRQPRVDAVPAAVGHRGAHVAARRKLVVVVLVEDDGLASEQVALHRPEIHRRDESVTQLDRIYVTRTVLTLLSPDPYAYVFYITFSIA